MILYGSNKWFKVNKTRTFTNNNTIYGNILIRDRRNTILKKYLNIFGLVYKF